MQNIIKTHAKTSNLRKIFSLATEKQATKGHVFENRAEESG